MRITDAWSIDVARDDPRDARIAMAERADYPNFIVECYALTANVLTYAAMGDRYGYWSLYPGSAGRGHIPAWGYASGASPDNADEISVFGLMPMASHVSLDLRATRSGWREAGNGRAALNPVYNRYATAADPKQRDANMLFRPLLVAAFVLDQWLRDEAWFGADTILVTSASSKTAVGFAMLAKDRVRLVGLTAPARRDFVTDTTLYDAVFSYGETSAHTGTVVIVDFAGDDHLVADMLQQLGTRCVRIVRIGRTHWSATNSGDDDRFFAPIHIERLVGIWGAETFETRLSEMIAQFDALSVAWFRKRYLDGPDAILAGYRELAGGTIDPAALLIARPSGGPA